MRIPKHIEQALNRRMKSAYVFNETDYIISTYLDKMGIETETYDTHGGVEAIVNPYESAERIRKAILNHEKQTLQ